MKILLINKFDSKGGAAIATKRLFEALKSENVDVELLVQSTTEKNYISTTHNIFKKLLNFLRFSLERLKIYFNIKNKSDLFFFDSASFGENLSNHPAVKKADIIHLHWINFGFLSLKSLEKLFSLGKPIFWTLHDMWPLTGGCFHSRGCRQYESKCDICHFLKPKSKLAKKTFLKKQKLLKRKNLHIIAISNWSKKIIEKSSLIKSNSFLIGNPINTDFFISLDKIKTKNKLNLDSNKIHLGFIALNITNVFKGGKYLIEALNLIKANNSVLFEKIELLAIGRIKDKMFFPKSLNIKYVGYVNEEKTIRDYYNAMDLFILPSLEENLPLVIQEAMSCGIPVVAFNTGGISDLIDHNINGYLAEYKNSHDLSNGIMELIVDSNKYKKISDSAREKILNNYSYPVIAKKYIEIYNKVVQH